MESNDSQVLEVNLRTLGDAVLSLSVQVASLVDRVDVAANRLNASLDRLGSCLDQSSGQKMSFTSMVRRPTRPGELSGAQQFFRAAGKPTRFRSVRGYDHLGRKVSFFNGYYG